jgi:hypothetical protein
LTIDDVIGLVPAEKKAEVGATIDAYKKSVITIPASVAEADKYLEEHPTFRSALDSRISRAVLSHDEKFKADKLPTLIEEEYKKRNPAKDPKELELEKLRGEMDKIKKDAAYDKQKARALAKLAEKGLPAKLADRYTGYTDEETDAAIADLLGTVEPFLNEREKKIKEELISKAPAPEGGKDVSGKTAIKRSDFNALDPMGQREALKSGYLVD